LNFRPRRAVKAPNGDPILPAQQVNHALLLLPAELAVDANRDGIIKFAGNVASASLATKTVDRTSEARPFRFWCNDDDDGDQGDVVPVSSPNCGDQFMAGGRRDLEDFARLHLFIGGLHEAIVSGKIKVGLKWKNTNGTNPSINIFKAVESDGGTKYLTDDATAAAQSPVNANTQTVPQNFEFHPYQRRQRIHHQPGFLAGFNLHQHEQIPSVRGLHRRQGATRDHNPQSRWHRDRRRAGGLAGFDERQKNVSTW